MKDNVNERINAIIFRFVLLAVMVLGTAIAVLIFIQSRLPSEYEKSLVILAEQNKKLRITNTEYLKEANIPVSLKDLMIEDEHVFYDIEDSHSYANNGQKLEETLVPYTRDDRKNKDGYESYVKIALNGQFDSMTAYIYVPEQALRMPISDFETDDWEQSNVSIYADGKLCYTKTGINYKANPIPIDINTVGVEILEIRFNPSTNHKSGNSVYTLMGVGNITFNSSTAK